MPVGQIEDIYLSLIDRDQWCRVGNVLVEEAGHLGPPCFQLVHVLAGLVEPFDDGHRLDRVEVGENAT